MRLRLHPPPTRQEKTMQHEVISIQQDEATNQHQVLLQKRLKDNLSDDVLHGLEEREQYRLTKL